ncbi:hypothetical protein LELG_00023 [Lodderomyces elongisporus NRRL YB-4239]|uniref:Uncharacterized protein n=1 Tax=Lodderomyces elongisporus (strain ATCC 11503 / CBS 2605 / JCM 1781 / NBRC 1676 / NRRL YB-4239) TaxID=379508 RepID=A5DRN7_LODEL|nr:hypothetical protein LELG_00023 [Lodderomyces elongisporus NRRL YB-4239]
MALVLQNLSLPSSSKYLLLILRAIKHSGWQVLSSNVVLPLHFDYKSKASLIVNLLQACSIHSAVLTFNKIVLGVVQKIRQEVLQNIDSSYKEFSCFIITNLLNFKFELNDAVKSVIQEVALLLGMTNLSAFGSDKLTVEQKADSINLLNTVQVGDEPVGASLVEETRDLAVLCTLLERNRETNQNTKWKIVFSLLRAFVTNAFGYNYNFRDESFGRFIRMILEILWSINDRDAQYMNPYYQKCLRSIYGFALWCKHILFEGYTEPAYFEGLETFLVTRGLKLNVNVNFGPSFSVEKLIDDLERVELLDIGQNQNINKNVTVDITENTSDNNDESVYCLDY